ncbi:MAG TPA: acetyl-CoA carboxylase biotin carboxylase subunit [Vicinamibacterales bacterium]
MRKILVANRGEIAVRIIRACRDMGIASVAVYSECDRAALHVRMADEAVAIGPNPPAESYLRTGTIVDAARASGADAVHPGYGFLAENEDFAAACREAGVTFIGPSPEAIALMGSKTAARRVAIAAGVPVVPGTEEALGAEVPVAAIASLADRIGYPIMIKAVAGGGGKGMRLVAGPGDLAGALRAARSEAGAAFGDSAVYLERRLLRPRHIEVQLLADAHGTVLPFVERECSIQRRHQKVIEETPSPVVSSGARARLTEAAAAVARSAGYTNAGTIEFLLDEDGRFYFLEMNTRLQVEHPVTEMVTGVDLVQWQIRIARGERLDLDRGTLLAPRGHSIECRIYAEDPDAGFMPSPGRITALRVPDGPGVRDDSGVEAGGEVPIHYDPLVSKLVTWGADRPQAIARMQRALREYDVRGIRTTVPFFKWMLQQPAFADAQFHTGYLDEVLQQRQGIPFLTAEPSLEEVAAIAAAVTAASRVKPEATVPRSEWQARARVEGLRP